MQSRGELLGSRTTTAVTLQAPPPPGFWHFVVVVRALSLIEPQVVGGSRRRPLAACGTCWRERVASRSTRVAVLPFLLGGTILYRPSAVQCRPLGSSESVGTQITHLPWFDDLLCATQKRAQRQKEKPAATTSLAWCREWVRCGPASSSASASAASASAANGRGLATKRGDICRSSDGAFLPTAASRPGGAGAAWCRRLWTSARWRQHRRL